METYKSNYIQKNYVEGKVIIITGASSGFGKLTAKRAAEMGGKIVLAARSEEKLKETGGRGGQLHRNRRGEKGRCFRNG